MADRATSAARAAITFSILREIRSMSFTLAAGGASLESMTAIDMPARPGRDAYCWRIASPQGSALIEPSLDLARHASPSPESRCKAEPPPPHHSEEGNVPV